jgi:chloramphenicol O-acetyltransferase type A
MPLRELLDSYEATPLRVDELPPFDQAALGFFCNSDLVDDPLIDFSFLLNIDDAKRAFDAKHQTTPGATFTAYLLWAAATSLANNRRLNWRKCGDTWYELGNPPFYMPIATGQASRLASTVLTNVKGSSFESFAKQYARAVEDAINGKAPALADDDVFALAHNISNLPNLRFTSIKPHAARHKSTHVWWCFGQRHQTTEGLCVPVAVRMHHANGDPVVLDELVKAFKKAVV